MTKILFTQYLKILVTLVLGIITNYFLLPFIIEIAGNTNSYSTYSLYFDYRAISSQIKYMVVWSSVTIIFLVLIDLFIIVRIILLCIGYSKTKKGYE